MAQIKTKAEIGLAEQYSKVADTLPGDGAVRDVRDSAIRVFATEGFPHRRIEEWKYTDLRAMVADALPLKAGTDKAVTRADVDAALGPLAALDAQRLVMVDGAFSKDLSDGVSQDGVSYTCLSDALVKGPVSLDGFGAGEAFPLDEPLVALNAAYMNYGAVIDIAAGAKVAKPILIAHLRTCDEPGLAAARHVITVGAGADVEIVEAYVPSSTAVAGGLTNTVTELRVGDNAEVRHTKTVTEKGGMQHLSNFIIRLGQGADCKAYQHTQGTALARNQSFITFDGEGASLDLSGSYLASEKQHIDTTLVVDHAVPGCTSRELFKGVLDDRGRGVFQGKVVVRQIAQKTDGKQMAQVLMLSPDAEFDSKPELEIYADDVACGHGSTSAELDPDLMFYCKARGIPEAEARALLIQSFIGEAIAQVENETVRDALTAFSATWLETANTGLVAKTTEQERPQS